jgi:hypothetical protein
MLSVTEINRPYVQESKKTQKIRDKIIETWESDNCSITPQAIEEAREKIHKWIADHSHERVSIKNKNIGLFNENQNSAEASRKVQQIAKQLQII